MKSQEQTITITVTMRQRWIPHFLGMLKKMEWLGTIGASRIVSMYADGDGDFRPKFQWDSNLPEPAKPLQDDPKGDVRDNGYLFDAG